ncbi:hypothetical protein M0813_28013 [Anaeramoeba flamelloides]|uniref:Uncharacterized protein n=1 Tax=Anaeramoeba flamelloides TaxID=1746091 RepID=A0ABQ8XV56_9EUKA|nr:hypothetical protein M0813_28013 [Anaeramoeba flamelloides]
MNKVIHPTFITLHVLVIIGAFFYPWYMSKNVTQSNFLVGNYSVAMAIYGFFAIIGENKIDEWSRDKFINEDKIYYIFVFIWLTITEIIPCLIIWVVFHLTLNRTKQTLYAPIENENDEI